MRIAKRHWAFSLSFSSSCAWQFAFRTAVAVWAATVSWAATLSAAALGQWARPLGLQLYPAQVSASMPAIA